MKKIWPVILASFAFLLLSIPALAQGGWTVVTWYGDPVELTGGWQVCDGTNGTPDLRDQFLVGAGTTYDLGDTGGIITNSLSHRHQVTSHQHTISSVDLSHTHTQPGHTHSISTVDLSHTHIVAFHSHSIGNDSHSHSLVGEAGGGPAYSGWVAYGAQGDYLTYHIPGGGGLTIYYVTRYTTSYSHNHGGYTGTDSPSTGSMSANTSHNHGGATGSGGADATGSALTTHNHGGTTGSASPMTDYQLSTVENRPPYTALYYICRLGIIEPITASLLITDPVVTTYYTTTLGTYSEVKSISYGERTIVNGLAVLIVLSVLQIIITLARRRR